MRAKRASIRSRWWVELTAFFLLCLALLGWLGQPISKVVVTRKDDNIALLEVKTLMKPYVPSAWGFGSLQALQQAIQLADWVGAVTLRRVWPGELHAIVALRKPVAMLDDITYVDRQAQVFHALRPLKGAVPVQWFAEEDESIAPWSYLVKGP